MSGAAIMCPSGHSNSATQKFCGECGTSLVAACPNGHQNPDGQRYCGECGCELGQISNSKSDADQPAGTLGPSESPNPPVNPARATAGQGTQVPEGGTVRVKLHTGDELMMPDSIKATVVKYNDDTVWLNIAKGQSSIGVSTFPRRDVERFLATNRRMADRDHSAPAGETHIAPGSLGGTSSAQSPHTTLGSPQPNQTVAANIFSVIAFVLAGLAVLGGLTLVALPLIFGIAGVICAGVALAKKERLSQFAIGAAVGGLIVGWILQAAVFNAVFG